MKNANTTSVTSLNEDKINLHEQIKSTAKFETAPANHTIHEENNHIEKCADNDFIENNFAGVIQENSDKLVLELNNHLADLIHEAKLDPIVDVFADAKTLGNIRLGLVSSDIVSEYALTDLTGLASLNIISIDNTHLTRDKLHFNLHAGMPLQLQQDLHTNISGEIRSRIGFFGQSMTISGHAKVTNVNIDASIKIQGQVNLHLKKSPEILFSQLSIERMVIDYDEITVNVDGLGVLNRFISPFSVVLSRILKSYLTKAADREVIQAINTKLAALFPFKFSIANIQGHKSAS